MTPTARSLRPPPRTPAAAPRRGAVLGLLAAGLSVAVACLLVLRVAGRPEAPRGNAGVPAAGAARAPIPAPQAAVPTTYAEGAEEALALARFAESIEGRNPRAATLRGAILSEAGDHSGAADAFRTLIAARPDSAEARYRLGMGAARDGRDAEAAALLQEAIRLDPSLPDIQGQLGRALLKLDRVDEAASVLESAPGDDRGAAVRLFHLGHARLRQGRDAEARDAFQGAVDRSPGYTGAWYGLATAAARLGDDAQAAAAREEFRRLKVRDSEAAAANLGRDEAERMRGLLGRWYATAAKLAFDAGDIPSAEACLRRGLVLTPDLPDLHQGLDVLSRGAPRAARGR